MSAEEEGPSDVPLTQRLQRASGQPENPFAALIPHQHIAIVPSFTLESGVTLRNVPVAYCTRGRLNPKGDNVLVICHALSGSADVADWWGPLMGGAGRAFDMTRFFIVCLNSLGSPYGSASPVTSVDGNPKCERYGPEFPLTTVRDDVNIHKLVLDDLGVVQIAAAVGGSMGGMLVLEYAYFGTDYVRAIVPIATSSRHSAWGISWGEAQRQSIYCDPKYENGYYPFNDPPAAGLGAARMSALLMYRSRDSFERRFGRNTPDPSRRQAINDSERPSTPSNEHWAVHNEGHKTSRMTRPSGDHGNASLPSTSPSDAPQSVVNGNSAQFSDPQFHGATSFAPPNPPYSAQSYLRYQGEKFVKRFDSNCYIAITRKLDTHDVSRYRVPPDTPNPVAVALSQIKQPALVIGIESDGLFTFAEQQELAAAIPDSRLRTIDSPEGHDAFLLQFEQVNRHILEFFNEVLLDIMKAPGLRSQDNEGDEEQGVTTIAKSSTFGEAEARIWRSLARIGFWLHTFPKPSPPPPSFLRPFTATALDGTRSATLELAFYVPPGYSRQIQQGERYPVVVNYHGGGFTMGRSSDDARWAWFLVRHVSAVVVCVAYRLAPEHPFPTAVEDGVSALLHLSANAGALGLDTAKVSLSGFSAGGNLAFTIPLRLQLHLRSIGAKEQERDPPGLPHIVSIMAWYPNVDNRLSRPQRRAASIDPSKTIPSLLTDLFDASYLPDHASAASPFVSPAAATDDALITALPDDIALFLCEWDMLLREGRDFAERLEGLGKRVRCEVVRERRHGFDKSPWPFGLDWKVGVYYMQACGWLSDVLEEV